MFGNVLALLATGASASSPGNHTFDSFVQEFGRTYASGSAEYERRRAYFESHVEHVLAVNSRDGGRWKASVNSLADWSPEELAALRGYKRHVRPSVGGGGRGPVQLLTTKATPTSISTLPRDFTWKGKLNATTEIMDQGQCGSCWAFGSAAVLRAHSQLHQEDRKFSTEQIVSCTTNPDACGGSGGCDGATAELAMDYVMRTGCMTEGEFPYAENVARCPGGAVSRQTKSQPTDGGVKDLMAGGASFAEVQHTGGMKFGMVGWSRLPENQLEPVLLALYDHGPAVVSIHAGYEWNLYEAGILDDCEADTVIDHAVMLLGWGCEGEHCYWQLQNSWGPGWGENGHIRIKRAETFEEEKKYCGWDTEPEIGSGCKGGPSKAYVCGHCGILNDVVQPRFSLSENGWWARHGGRQADAEDAFAQLAQVSMSQLRKAPTTVPVSSHRGLRGAL